MIYKIKKNYLVFLFFLFYLLIGIYILPSYPITPDEPLHRVNGFISLKYIFDLFNIDLLLNNFFSNIPSLYSDWRKTYGTLFDLPIAATEFFLRIDDKSDIFLIRHLFNFLLFFISCIYFFKFLNKNFNNKYLSIIGVIFLIFSPRIFGNSFYNSKDIVFLSLFIISFYYSVNLLKKFTYKNFFLSFVFCAFASNIRIIGIYLPFLVILTYLFNLKFVNKKNIYFIFLYFLGYFLTLYIVWPYLWENPVENFLIILSESMNYPSWWDFKVLYFGNYLNPENLPWHYFFVWFAITTPPVFLFLILAGLIRYIKSFIPLFLNIDLNKNFYLWRTNEEMISFFILLIFLVPIFFVVTLNSTLYNGWRHLYFLYPSLIYFSISFLFYVYKSKKKLFYFIFGLILTQIVSNINFIYKSHPAQATYFNFFLSKNFVQNNFPIDYWGVANIKSIQKLIKFNEYKINVSTSSYTNLSNLRYSKNIDINNIILSGTSLESKESSDFIFTNFYYHDNPRKISKYNIPENYITYQKLYINGILINELYKKK